MRQLKPWALGSFAAIFIAFVAWLAGQMLQGDLERSDRLASIVSMSIALASLPVTVVTLFVVGGSGHREVTVDPTTRLNAVAEALAMAVRSQWEAEEKIRRIHDPFPLQIQWANASETLVDYWQNIRGSPGLSAAIPLAGSGDQITDTFRRIPSGRLVVLGRAGAGKTILASRFVLKLLATRKPGCGSVVPVIFSLGSWDPTVSSLQSWLCGQLASNYPTLAERDGMISLASQLLSTRRILPVLDGFDEITEKLRANAIIGINAGLRVGDQFLMTSRPHEYASVVAAGDVLAGAAVVEIADLTVSDLGPYLPLTTHRRIAGATYGKWQPVLDHLHRAPGESALSAVLSTPLMVALARTVFSDTNADPREMIDTSSSDIDKDRRALEHRTLFNTPGEGEEE